jgi:hypothetical protein
MYFHENPLSTGNRVSDKTGEALVFHHDRFILEKAFNHEVHERLHGCRR